MLGFWKKLVNKNLMQYIICKENLSSKVNYKNSNGRENSHNSNNNN